MKTFIIFNRKSGEISQTHVQAGDLRSCQEEFLKIARPEAEGANIDIMEVEGLMPGISYRVDVKTKKLVEMERGKARGAGVAHMQPVNGDPLTARTVFLHLEKRERKKK